MKLKILLAIILCLLVRTNLIAQQLTVGTYNLRLQISIDTGNLWLDRAQKVADLIRFHDFDILGTQEGFLNQLEDIQKLLPYYAFSGVGRDDGKLKGEHSAIFYKTEKFQMLDHGDFWLSETPEKPGLGWEAKYPRICSWIKLKEKKTKKVFFFFNTHFDHEANNARLQSSFLILKKVKEIAGDVPVVLTGDFNSAQNTQWYKNIAESDIFKDCFILAKHPYASNGTFNDFGRNLKDSSIIDHIFITSSFSVNRCGILSDSYLGKFPSDHFPVLVSLEWRKGSR
jgi:endonuclease/exonuclease/phosphatase family metal-dependent hydrolase